MTAIEATGIGAAVAVAILARRRILLALFVLLMPASWVAGAIIKVYPTLMEWEKLKKSTKYGGSKCKGQQNQSNTCAIPLLRMSA